MDTLVVGDHFIPASFYVDTLGTTLGPDLGEVRTVAWSGAKDEQHAAQQQMEWNGPDAVPVPEEIVAAVAGVEALCVHFAPVPRAVLEAGKRLRVVVVARAGVENVDIAAASELGIAVVNVAGRNASAVAELSIGLMLSEARDIARADASVKAGGWRKTFQVTPSLELGGSTVGLVGFGHVGRHLARKIAGFGVRILVHDPYVPASVITELGGTQVDLDTVFRESDFVSVQARVTEETERFIGSVHLGLMKPTAYFVNVGRSRLVRTDDLYAAVSEGRIAGAALDVHDDEPLPRDSPWRSLDNVTLTTHYAGDTLQTNLTSARLVAEGVADFVRTGRPANTVNAVQLGWQ